MVFASAHTAIDRSDLAAADRKRKTIFHAKTDVAELGALCVQLRHTRCDAINRCRDIVEYICCERLKLHRYKVTPLMHAGTFRVLFRITSPKSQPLMIRINRLYEYGRAWDFLIEACVYPLLAQQGLAVPTIIDVDISQRYVAADYQVMTYVRGKTLKSFEDEQTQYMSPFLLRSIGAYVARVHSIKISGYGPLAVVPLMVPHVLPRGVHDSWSDYILLRLEEHAGLCKEIGAINASEYAIILELFRRYEPLFKNVSPSLLHGDVGNQNFLSDDGETITALVDWEDSMAGDPVFEVALWGTFFRDYMRNTLLEGYTTVNRLPHDFELRYWMYYLRIVLSKTVHRFRFGYADRPGRPRISLRIQKALSRIEALKNF
ncbi:MAG: aminoglycoside phosphotransferase family protein [Candidatus Babeliales bacterium]|jgi:aminoglycoside phosphotransferase (APT) family kinase protein